MKTRSNYSNTKPTRRQGNNFKYTKFILVLLIVLGIIFIFLKLSANKPKELAKYIISPISAGFVLGDSVSSNNTNLNANIFTTNLNSDDLKNYGIEVLNLKTGEEYSLNSHLSFPAASLYKLWVMAVVYQKLQNHEFDLNTQLTARVKDLNEKFNIDKELAEKTDGNISQTIKDSLEQMITISDNYSALLLTNKIGIDSLRQFLTENGLIESKVGLNGKSPTTTAYDTGLFFYKLYNGEFGNSKNTAEMINLLTKQVLNDKLPKYLPETVSVAHKTGEIDDYSHDAGIIYTIDTRYIVVVLSKSSDLETANENIAQISKNIYEYFEK